MSDIDEFNDDSGEEEEETMTTQEVLEKLEEAWLNEKFSPDLLESKSDLVECMLEQINGMEENIKRAKRGDFKVSIHRMEIDRIRYIVSSYLRCRLRKIENYTTYILEQERQRNEEDNSRLSPEELTYAEDYSNVLTGHLKTLALRHMPPNLQSLDPKQTVNRDTEGVLVEEETLDTGEEIVDLQQYDQHIMRYRPIAPLWGKTMKWAFTCPCVTCVNLLECKKHCLKSKMSMLDSLNNIKYIFMAIRKTTGFWFIIKQYNPDKYQKCLYFSTVIEPPILQYIQNYQYWGVNIYTTMYYWEWSRTTSTVE
ncbi:hypothetical protein KUTeg_005560 [Tegillarca granosa]|uniref:DNA replication complex GINS protein SLD5 n=1 Tax=Tegillarca granosa TaxID=220873 RepID=A0ABQ9FLQ1_TEGGR|nr:hypothetical protein KUTeg_005560 [Tegillarca granosa]